MQFSAETKLYGSTPMLMKRPITSVHVIGVNRGEHQVAGERGIDGDLRGFLVANFADHDFVRVVAQDGAQAAREGEAFLFVHRNLGDAADLIFHRIFDGDDLVFVVLDFVDGGVERGRLARAGGSGDEHHAVRLVDVAAELRHFVRPSKPTTSSVRLRNFSLSVSLSRTRSTASSPWTEGMMETRKSTKRPL